MKQNDWMTQCVLMRLESIYTATILGKEGDIHGASIIGMLCSVYGEFEMQAGRCLYSK
jgi:hypothetical protein